MGYADHLVYAINAHTHTHLNSDVIQSLHSYIYRYVGIIWSYVTSNKINDVFLYITRVMKNCLKQNDYIYTPHAIGPHDATYVWC